MYDSSAHTTADTCQGCLFYPLHTYMSFPLQWEWRKDYRSFGLFLPMDYPHEGKFMCKGIRKNCPWLDSRVVSHYNAVLLIISDWQSEAIIPTGSAAPRYDMVWH